ncbi:MAG: C-terminal target protein [Flavipsychrobacter sp.]|nr:C-terminal target protein [Flavipsychrobacter sp.]
MKYRFILFVLSCALSSMPAQSQMKQIISIAGNGETGYSGDGGTSVDAKLSAPLGVAIDASGNVYIQDVFNNRVRKVSTAGIITTFAGLGTEGYTGDGTNAQTAQVMPSGIATDKYGNVFIADAAHSVIRKVNTLGIISTYAGTGTFGRTGDGGPATAARIGKPYGITVDTFGNLYMADAGANVVRRVSKTGIITTIAGDDTARYAGDGGMATLASLDSPYSVAVDVYGNVFISDFFNDVVRVVTPDHMINTYAGIHGNKNYSGDDGPATAADLNRPRGIAVDMTGNLYIADAENNVIRMVDPSGIITTVVGNGTLGFGGDGGYALGANLHNPYAVTVDRYGSIYVADANNQRIRKAFNPKLAVNNVVNGSGVQVYPNPCSDAINITGLIAGDKVCVYDMAGRAVSEVKIAVNSRQAFDVKNIASGLYMLQVADATGDKKAVVKLVKE